MTLRAIVIGAGWAGEGHTIGLRAAGVDVVALVGRTPEPAHARAQQLGVANVRFDWQAALDEFSPDIVSIATPGDTHRIIAEYAAAHGCHIVCEKPLAITAADAQVMLKAVEKAGVKHAYAATGCYAPATLHAESLVAQGAIGVVREIEYYERFALPPNMPYTWALDTAHGGGMLANMFPHRLAQVLRATGGTVLAATGVATMQRERRPVAPMIHDFRQVFGPIDGWDPAQATEWRMAETDMAYSMVVDLRMPQGHSARATFQMSGCGTSSFAQQIALYGDGGTLVFGHGHHDELVRRYDPAREVWEDLPAPEGLLISLPAVAEPVQRAWNQFFREFVADIRGLGIPNYPTFHDGLIASEVIERVRYGSLASVSDSVERAIAVGG
jgi:predicted dehydrogenase